MESIPRPVPKTKLMLNSGFHELKLNFNILAITKVVGDKKIVIRRIKATLDLGQACSEP